ncbi:putative methyltransferase nsun7 [Physocladia obscura]|uniref:Methyltransferase nsun7 n=1 Tax=Physocladia obscura TaxID=109957 RepID=A0AAD5XCY0_9FUNG|nr:putative methyltransferase nsun7 [Physocladia obscura]
MFKNNKSVSDGNLIFDSPDVGRNAKENGKLLATRSEPVISTRKLHPLLDDVEGRRHEYSELIYAAETLENIAAEGVYAGATMRRLKAAGDKSNNGEQNHEMNDQILRMVYGTMKYLPYIDTILVKTQFLVYNNQATRNESEFHHAEIVKDLENALRQFEVKLAAAFARVRIERRASGNTSQEMLENILPAEVREKEHIAGELLAYFQIFLKWPKHVAEELKEAGYKVKISRVNLEDAIEISSVNEEYICVDDLFNDFLIIPTSCFSDIKNSPIVTEGKLILQDKASAYGIRHLTSLIAETDSIIDTRAGCGTHVSYLASLMKNKGKLFAFESRPSRVQSLKARLANQNVKNVEIIEEDFVTSASEDEKFADVTTIIVEPPNSGTAVVDKLGYLLQEEVPNVQTILYMTRTSNIEENEATVNEFLEKQKEDWELNCVMPDIIVTTEHEWEIEDCLKIKPTNHGNGVFVACFTRIARSESESEEAIEELTSEQVPSKNRFDREKKKKKKVTNGGTRGKKSFGRTLDASSSSLSLLGTSQHRKLAKKLSLSIDRLSVPRIPSLLAEREPKKIDKSHQIDRHDSKGVQDFNEPENIIETESNEKSHCFDLDFNIFGVSLKQFYEPKFQAIHEMKVQKIEPIDKRWRYPIPNPKPWK